MACGVEEVVEEVLEAVRVATGLRSKGLKQAAIQSALSEVKWRHVEPVSVGDDYSLVLKVPNLRPCGRGEVEAHGVGEVAEPIKNFPLVVKLGEGYVAIGASSLRVSLKATRGALEKVLRLCIKA
ncbi:MAG: hypothetical protein N3H31_03135 [Candidatus Nezhaarchaeota archaeon]|nr:hypothetical protein [Candidatus Nezhaarchaeota archaeon]